MKNLPHFTIRENIKAKRVILKVSESYGLEIIIPKGFSQSRLKQIIHEKREWIEQAWQKTKTAVASRNRQRTLPERIYFAAVQVEFQVEYVEAPIAFTELVHEDGATLRIKGDVTDFRGCQDLLKRWLHHQGRRYLIPWLERISCEIQLPFQNAQIRGQKSRWGSCSSRKTICLNHNLLFLRPELVRYLIIHELCHTVHLNHSADFYQFLGHFVPDYAMLRAELKKNQDQVPWWTF
jgi:predicted metal-dependent hydrolase